MKIFECKKQLDGRLRVSLFNKKLFSCKFPCEYRRLYNKRFSGLTQEEIRYILEVQFECALGYKLNLDNPKTYNEKIQWIKYFYHEPLLSQCADKVAVREYVKNTIGEQYLIPSFGVYENPEEIDYDKLPNKFVLKVNWGCKQNIIVRDKTKLNINSAKKKLKNWMKPKNNHYYENFEWVYKDIKPKILCEQLVEAKNDDLRDYKFFCFNGKVECMMMVFGKVKGEKIGFNFYDRNLKLADFNLNGRKTNPNKIPMITNYDKMLNLAEKLSKPFPHVRVDFYEDINKNIYVGELTFTSSNGTKAFVPTEWDYKLGEKFILPKLNK